jgi:imidazolonepropionase-like amidohydrolase
LVLTQEHLPRAAARDAFEKGWARCLDGIANLLSSAPLWAAEGATSFKVYTDITRAELRAAIEAAHGHGLTITGHLCSIGFSEAAEMGIDNVERGLYVDTASHSQTGGYSCWQAAGICFAAS